MRKGWESWTCSSLGRDDGGIAINAHKHVKCRHQENGDKLFSLVPSGDKWQSAQTEHMKFHLNMKKNCFSLRVTEHWNRLPREVSESLSLDILTTCLNTILCYQF